MANIVLAWELGGGLGHVIQLQPLAQGLIARGHTVFVILKDLSRARGILTGGGTRLLQAAVKIRSEGDEFQRPMTFAHMLHNLGWGNPQELEAMAGSWRALFQMIRPELLILDHSPTALLGSRGLPTKRVLIGSGFFSPPDQPTLPNLRHWAAADPSALRRDELQVLDTANQVLRSWGQPAIERLTQIYSETDENFLTTFPELDHYQGRAGAAYWGPWMTADGASPQWPTGGNKRIYAYLKPFPTLTALIERLAALGHSTIISADRVEPALISRLAGTTIRFETRRLNLNQVAGECDLAILNGNHFTTIYFLLAGKPALQLPITLEQALFSDAVCRRMQAGAHASIRRPEQMLAQLDRALNDPSIRQGAQAFADKYAGYDPKAQRDRMLGRLDELLMDSKEL